MACVHRVMPVIRSVIRLDTSLATSSCVVESKLDVCAFDAPKIILVKERPMNISIFLFV